MVVSEGPDTGLCRTLGLAGMRIGTAPSNELPLKDRTVSRFHCEVRIVGNVARLVDSGSTNGTFVDGVRVRDAELSAGSKVRVGATVLSVSASGERSLVDLSPRHSFGEVLGVSVEMRRLYAIPEKIAPTDTPQVPGFKAKPGPAKRARGARHSRLVTARHEISPSSSSTAVAIAEEPDRPESELFGLRARQRSAALAGCSDRRGLFEEADGRHPVLGRDRRAASPALQFRRPPARARALRGATRRAANTRASASTCASSLPRIARRCAENVNAGTFREDLYYQ